MIAEMVGQQMTGTIRYVEPVRYGSATGLIAELYQQMKADFMVGPVMTLQSPLPEVMAGAWSILRETLLAGRVDRAIKEAVAAAVSKKNQCHFCVDAHTLMLRAIGKHDVADAILRGDYDSIHDGQLRSLFQWATADQITDPNQLSFSAFGRRDAPELIGTAVVFHYVNRMVDVFLGQAVLPLPGAPNGVTRRLYAATMDKKIVRPLEQGNSLKFVPQSELPHDLSWASGNSAMAAAFAGFATVVEEVGKTVLPEEVRVLIREYVQAWNGEVMGISPRWVEDAVVHMKRAHRSAARLTLLTALAPYQVDSCAVEEFRSQYSDDAQLIAATAWASFTAARRAGVWLAAPFGIIGGNHV